jgi:uncharacterized membrane protein
MMITGQNELRVIWLISLVIVGLSCWYLNVHVVSYLCGLGFMMSVMHYVNALQQPIDQLAQVSIQPYSKVPLYISSVVIVLGGVLHVNAMVTLGITAWIFFLLRWLQRLEQKLIQVQKQARESIVIAETSQDTQQLEAPLSRPIGLAQQLHDWLFQGNPVLKAAMMILVVGVVLLLRFATEHWQISLAFKLAVIAAIGFAISLFGLSLFSKNRSFAIALEGFGLGVLFLSLFFAYYNLVIANLWIAAAIFVAIQVMTLYLSLKQQSIEIALMALLIAYIAPFTLPVRDASAVELISYYLLINVAVAILTSLRPWKYLNQIAFLMTAVVGAGYSLWHGLHGEKWAMTALIFAHSAIFIWLGFRFSQLISQSDLVKFKLKPVLDFALIFAVPLSAYMALYLIHFNDSWVQVMCSLAYALVFALLAWLTKRQGDPLTLQHCYFSLILIFLAFIPPILLADEWSVTGWAIEGCMIYLFALYRHSLMSRYLASALLFIAGLTSLYYFLNMASAPKAIYWILAISYLLVVFVANLVERFRLQLNYASVTLLGLLSSAASLILFMLLKDHFSFPYQYVGSLFVLSILLTMMNEAIVRRHQSWSWLIPKWCAMSPLLLIAMLVLIDQMQEGVVLWQSTGQLVVFAISHLIFSLLWLRPLLGIHEEKEWVSLGALLSLALVSICIIPSMPFLSVVILPLLFSAWCYRQSDDIWQMFWQAKSTLVLMGLWIVCSQLFSQQSFTAYFLPILNPFDAISIAMLASFIWMLSQQIKAGRDRGIVAVLMVLSLLWLSSYIVLRALHYYLATPFNELSLWQDATVQLSLTLLWVVLAGLTMWRATQKKLKPMWVLGASILVLVSLKLVLFDLSHIGTLSRVISFLMAGGLMLLIAYMAPMPQSSEP